MIEAPSLQHLRGIRHRFLTRQGGVSTGAFAGLNCGFTTGDDPINVQRNRAIAALELGIDIEHLITAKQVHGTSVATVTRPFRGAQPEHDALVTATPGLALGVLTADCAPVILADAEASVVGIAHAGWRGALAGVIEAAIGAMTRLGAQAQRIAAAVGPTIAQASYEVGPEFESEFVHKDAASAPFFTAAATEGRYRFDLPEYVGARLLSAGVTRIEVLPCDTLGDPVRFFSFRRSTLAGERQCGRQLSAIMLTP